MLILHWYVVDHVMQCEAGNGPVRACLCVCTCACMEKAKISSGIYSGTESFNRIAARLYPCVLYIVRSK